jgi:hypothetical protein
MFCRKRGHRSEWFTLLLCIRLILGSGLDPVTGYPEFLVGFSVLYGECQNYALN